MVSQVGSGPRLDALDVVPLSVAVCAQQSTTSVSPELSDVEKVRPRPEV